MFFANVVAAMLATVIVPAGVAGPGVTAAPGSATAGGSTAGLDAQAAAIRPVAVSRAIRLNIQFPLFLVRGVPAPASTSVAGFD